MTTRWLIVLAFTNLLTMFLTDSWRVDMMVQWAASLPICPAEGVTPPRTSQTMSEVVEL